MTRVWVNISYIISARLLCVAMGFVDHLSVRCAMKYGLVDTRRLLKTEFREDAVDVALTRLSGVVYYLGCFSYTDTIHVVKEKAESLMESEG